MKTVVIPGGAGGGSKKYELVDCKVVDFKDEREDGIDGQVTPNADFAYTVRQQGLSDGLKWADNQIKLLDASVEAVGQKYERNRVLAWTWFSMLLVSWLIFFLVRMR
jgi:hypothetical protein